MDSGTETTREKKGSFCDLKLRVRELESKLFEQKQRFEVLQMEHAKHKSECLNLRETKSRLEMELKSFREREAEDQNMIQKLFGMVESYDKKLAEFMMKHGDENSSLRERNDAIVVKKEIEDNLDDEMSKRSKVLVPLAGDGDEDNFEIGKWTKKRAIREMWRRETSSGYALMPYRVGKSNEEDKVEKEKETTSGGDEAVFITVFGKDVMGRSRSIGTNIAHTHVKGAAIPCKRLKEAQGEFEQRLQNVEQKLTKLDNMDDKLERLLSIAQDNRQVGSEIGTSQFATSTNQLIDQRCGILNFKDEVIATGSTVLISSATLQLPRASKIPQHSTSPEALVLQHPLKSPGVSL